MEYFYIFFVTILTLIFVYLRHKFSYWQRKNVPYLKTNNFFGHISKMKSRHFSELTEEVYKKFKGLTPVAGIYIFTKPAIVALDLDLIKAILIKDFSKFTDRKKFRNEENDPLSLHLFTMQYEEWRKMRIKLTPTFTSGKMKFMFPTIVQVANEFQKLLLEIVEKSKNGELEIYDLMGRFTTDVIGTCVFGIECNSLKDPDSEFRRCGKLVFNHPNTPVWWIIFRFMFGNYLKIFGIKEISSEVSTFFMKIVKETVEFREINQIKRNDFMDLLIETKNKLDESGKKGLTMAQLAAQAFVFFGAGFETSSSNLTYGLFELARNPKIQEKLRHHILTILDKYEGQLTYEAMMEMQYLDQVISETLRKHPALGSLTRIAEEDYAVPNSKIIIEKGTPVLIPARMIHHDPEYYPNPDDFNPDNFSQEKLHLRHPQTFLGFGDGPRNCIGLRFGRMQSAIGFVSLLRSFRFRVSSKTPNEVELSPSSFILIPKAGVYLKVEKLQHTI